eukprot:GSChrysophyteH2.ASY1.ANO1.1018.1 assembled CDS
MFRPRTVGKAGVPVKKKAAIRASGTTKLKPSEGIAVSRANLLSPPPSIQSTSTLSPPVSHEGKSTESSHHHAPGPNPLFQSCRSVEAYEPMRFIEQGSFGLVFQARCKDTGAIYAIKQVKLDATSQQSGNNNRHGFPLTALREANILMQCSHPNIVHVKEMCMGSAEDKVYMVMGFAGRELRDSPSQETLYVPFSTPEVQRAMAQLLSAVAYLHKHGFMHRDIKTSNLLYDESSGVLTLADFGTARRYGAGNQQYTEVVCTLWYRDVAARYGAHGYGPEVDTWSCGCVLAELLTGVILFAEEGEVRQLHAILSLLDNTYGRIDVHSGTGSGGQLGELLGISGSGSGSGSGDSGSGSSGRSSGSSSQLDEIVGIRRHFQEPWGVSPSCCTLLASLLRLDPKKRGTPRQLLGHAWLAGQE